jgi:riboflavin kinase / FMN adenylyltransferase
MQVLTDRLAGTGRRSPSGLRQAVVAIGNFDGVHRGHQAVIAGAVQRARAAGRPAAVLLFDPHPRQYFQPEQPFFTITPLPLRLRLLAALGLDLAVVQPFDAGLAQLSADDFVSDVLVRGLGVAEVVVGYDFNYGRGRSGSLETLQAAGSVQGFAVTVVPAFAPTIGPPGAIGTPYSSSGIRTLLRAGNVAGAAQQLGHVWRVTGTVIGGAGRGTGLGFPTANLAMTAGQDLRHGIYAARVLRAGDPTPHAAAAYLGTRPTFDGGAPLLEVFLFDFDEDLYGETIDVEFVSHLRDDAAFISVEVLKVQMAADCDAARSALAATSASTWKLRPLLSNQLVPVASVPDVSV